MPEIIPSTALVVTDMQPVVLGMDRYRQKHEPERVIGRVRLALDAARASARVRVLHVLHIPFAPSLEPKAKTKDWRIEDELARARAEFPHPAFFAPQEEVAPADGEWIVSKPGFDLFDDFGQAGFLHGQGVRSVVFAGVKTDRCVFRSASHAVRAGFEASVILDATAANDPNLKHAALKELAGKGVHLLTLEQFREMCAES